MLLSRPLSLALLTVCLGCAADSGATITPAPGFEVPRPPAPGMTAGNPGQGRPMQQMPMMRPSPAYEVESLSITPGDAAGLVAWTELAAQGFHVVAASSDGGKQVLLLERMSPMGGKDLRLPAVVEANTDLAAATHAKIQAIAAERQHTMAPSSPVMAQPPMVLPSSAPAPMTPAAPAPVTPTPVPGK